MKSTCTKKSFREATCLKCIWNKIVEWNGLQLGAVMWHDKTWKLVDTKDFDLISDRAYKPIAEFHTQEELWKYIKQNNLDIIT